MSITHNLSPSELRKSEVLQRLISKTITQKDAAQTLGITTRQVRRLTSTYRDEGTAGLVHKARGRTSNRQLPQVTKDRAIELVKTKYPDFGPTLASEKLAELDNLKIDHETLRLLMVKEGLWRNKKRKAIHRERRERRACFGDMEQFDGCYHDWFEGRLPDGAWATLLASRDDANNEVYARFLGREGTKSVMTFWGHYFKAFGKPLSIYLDRHSTYKINAKSALDDDNMITQFERAMSEIGVEVIHANSPQAKGRIENLFSTLQDRLVKDLRLANISSIEEANIFLRAKFLPAFNTRFKVTPRSNEDVHRPLTSKDNLPAVLSVQSTRKVNQDFTVRFKNQWIQLTKAQPTLVLPGHQVTIEERLDSTMSIRRNFKYLNFKMLQVKPNPPKKPIAALANDQSRVKSRASTMPGANNTSRKIKLLPYNISNRRKQKPQSKRIT